jgi:hypothetical protein
MSASANINCARLLSTGDVVESRLEEETPKSSCCGTWLACVAAP